MASALKWALSHPANKGRKVWVMARWVMHQLGKRVLPQVALQVQVGSGMVVGPASHPVICLARYVRGGLADLDAFVVYASLLRPGDAFIDVGANIGLHSVMAASFLAPTGRVVACEPDGSSRRWLEQNLARCGVRSDIEARPLADEARALFWKRDGATLSHLSSSFEGEPIQTTTLDAVIEELRVEPARTVVKVDVEGWEAAVIAGGRASLDRGLRALWIEANGLQARSSVPWREAVRACQGFGMRFWILDLQGRRLLEQAAPELKSPTGHYLVAAPEVAARVAAKLQRWPDLLTGDLGRREGAS